MLGGAVDTHVTTYRGPPAVNEAGERIGAVAALARTYPNARLLLSGGAADHSTAEPITESAIAKDILTAAGVPPERIELEELSRDTCENAGASAAVASPKAGQVWLLVTSASHMPRAVACFRATGFPVVPYPVDFRTRDPSRQFGSVASGLATLDLAAHEWIGLVAYRLKGRTRELFPAP